MATVTEKPQKVVTEEYILAATGLVHREDGPAIVVRRADGTVIEKYARYGHWHRKDGPAIVIRSKVGIVLRAEYWLAGVEIDRRKPVSKTPRRKTAAAKKRKSKRRATAV